MKLDPAVKTLARDFILTAVARKNLRHAYTLVGPEIKQGQTLKQWMTGNIAVVPYPADAIDVAPFRIDYSYPREALIEVMLLPKAKAKIRATDFYLGVKKVGKGSNAHWVVTSWVPHVSPMVPSDAPTRVPVGKRLSSPRFRRRVSWLSAVGLLAASGRRGGRAAPEQQAAAGGLHEGAAEGLQDAADRSARSQRQGRGRVRRLELRQDGGSAHPRRRFLGHDRSEPAAGLHAAAVGDGRHSRRPVPGRRDPAAHDRLVVPRRRRARHRARPHGRQRPARRSRS